MGEPVCEILSTLTAAIVAQSSKRLVNGYASHWKKIESCRRISKSRSNDSGNQKNEAQANLARSSRVVPVCPANAIPVKSPISAK